MAKSELIFYLKERVDKRFIMELKIYKLLDKKYPDSVKYSLVFIEPHSGKKVLLDNHHPKGHHYHIDDKEYSYKYVNDDTLIQDFKMYVYQHFGVKL